MAALPLIKAGLFARRAFRKWREGKMFKGKLTYTTGIALAVQALAAALGFDVAPAEVDIVVAFVTLALNLYGRYRAPRSE